MPPAKRVVKTMPLSVKVEAGMPCSAIAVAERGRRTIGPVTRRWAVTEQRVAGVVVEPGEDLDVGAVGEAVVGEVGLASISLGCSAWKRM